MRPDVSTIAGRVRFNLEFALLMLGCGRTGEARSAFTDAFALLEQLEQLESDEGATA